MNSQKRRSSFFRPATEDNTTELKSVRVKKRISFMAKDDVRVFSKEECPRTVSAAPVAEDMEYCSPSPAASTTRQQQKSLPMPNPSLAPTVADKENFHYESRRQSNSLTPPKATNVSALCTTIDFINKPQRLSNFIQIENSVDFTLLPRDCARVHLNNNNNSTQNSDSGNSYLLDEFDLVCLRQAEANERKKDEQVPLELSKSHKSDKQPHLQRTIMLEQDMSLACTTLSTRTETQADRTKFMDESIFIEDGNNPPDTKAAAPITIFIDETVVADCNQSAVENNFKRSTTYQQVAIETDESEEYEKYVRGFRDRTKAAAPITIFIDETVVTDCNQSEVENILKRKSTYEQVAIVTDESAEFEKDFRGFLQTTIATPLKAAEMDISMQAASQNLTEIDGRIGGSEEKARKTINYDGEDDMEISMQVERLSLKVGKQQQRKTINFNGKDDADHLEESLAAVTTPKFDEPVKQRKSILFKDDGFDCNKMDITNCKDHSTLLPPLLAAPVVPDSTAKKHNAAKVVVVHKTCPQQARKPPPDLEKQRFLRYQKKQQQQEENLPINTNQINDKSKRNSIIDLSMAHHSRHDFISSPEFSSPLLPPEYLACGGNKKSNFRQLNHDIEHGKISFFPDTPKTPLAKRRALIALSAIKTGEGSNRKSIQHSRKKSKKELKNCTAEDEMQLSPVELCLSSNRKPETRRTYLNFNETDDMFDNTSFLTKAKLGDETASRNSSKASSSQRRETIHFNTEIEKYEHGLCETLQKDNKDTLTRKELISVSDGAKIKVCNENEMQQSIAFSHADKANCTNVSNAVLNQKRLTADFECAMDCTLPSKEHSNTKEIVSKPLDFSDKTLNFSADIALDLNLNNSKGIVSKPRQTLHSFNDIDLEGSNVAIQTKQYMKKNNVSNPRNTLHNAEDIEVENILPKSYLDTKKNNVSNPRHTLHFAEDIEEENILPKSNLDSTSQNIHISSNIAIKTDQYKKKNKVSNPRNTLYHAEDIEVENILPKSNLDTKKNKVSNSRNTLHYAEDIEVENIVPKSKIVTKKNKVSNPRHTLHFAEDIEEENILPKSNLDSTSQNIHNSSNIDIKTEQYIKKNKVSNPRNTLYHAEDIEVENILPKSNLDTKKNKVSNPRNTLYNAEDIEVENSLPKSNLDMKKNKVYNPRNTLHFAEDIAVENILPKSNLDITSQNLDNFGQVHQLTKHVADEEIAIVSKNRQTDNDIDLDEPKVAIKAKNDIKKNKVSNPRNTLHFVEDIEVENILPKTNLDSTRQNLHNSRQNIKEHVDGEMEIVSKPVATRHCFNNTDLDASNVDIKTKQDIKKNNVSNPRHTLHFAEDIEVENILPTSNLDNIHNSRQVQNTKGPADDEMHCTLLPSNEINIEIEENSNKPIVSKPKQTLLYNDDIEMEDERQDSFKTKHDTKNSVSSVTQALNSSDDIELILDNTPLKPNSDKIVKNSKISRLRAGIINTPIMNSEQHERLRRLYEGTPHRSLIEFLEVEKELVEEKELTKQIVNKSIKIDQVANDIGKGAVPKQKHSNKRQTTYAPVDIVPDVSDPMRIDASTNRNANRSTFVERLNRLTLQLEDNSNKKEIVPKLGQTIYCADDIDLEEDTVAERLKQNVAENKDSNPSQTLHFAEDIDLEVEIILPKPNSVSKNKKNHNSRQSKQLNAHVDDEMDCTLVPYNEINIELQDNSVKPKPIVSKPRQTLLCNNDIELENETHNGFNNKYDIKEVKVCSSTHMLDSSGKKLYSDEILKNPKISFLRAGIKNTLIKSPFRVINKALEKSSKLFPSGLKSQNLTTNVDDEMDLSLLRPNEAKQTAKKDNNETNLDETPIMNIEQHERLRLKEQELTKQSVNKKVTKFDQVPNDFDKCAVPRPTHSSRRQTTCSTADIDLDVSGLMCLDADADASANENANQSTFVNRLNTAADKRPAFANLTPNLPYSKKRQTVIFPDCDLETTLTMLPTNSAPNNKLDSVVDCKTQRSTLFLPVDIVDIEDTYRSNGALEANKSTSSVCMELSDDDCEIVLVASPTPSQIPMLRYSSRKSKHSFPQRLHTPIKLSCDNDDDLEKTSEKYFSNTIEEVRKCRTRDYTFLNLSDEIEKTKLSLVETLRDSDTADDDDGDEEQVVEPVVDPVVEPEVDPVEGDCQKVNTKNPASVATVGKNDASIMCRKCKRCQDTFINETISTATDSFILPALPPVTEVNSDLERLKRLRKRPTIELVQEYYERLELTEKVPVRDWFTPDGKVDFAVFVNDDDDEEDGKEEVEDEINIFIAEYKEDCKRSKQKIIDEFNKKPPKNLQQRQLFEVRLDNLASELLQDWTFDYQMQNILQFSHNNLMQFCVVILFEDKAGLGLDIAIKNVQLWPNRMPEKNWKPYDFMLHFQTELELSFDLRCRGNTETDVLEMMQKIDLLFAEIVKMGKELWKVVRTEQGSLVRIANRTYVRKIVRKIVTPDNSYARVESTEFRIEVMNFKKICFKDIVKPHLHLFREDIQNLPTGLEFLRVFLKDPCSYLKN